MKLVYDPQNATMSYGFFKCAVCGSEFYGGGRAMHKDGCSSTNYDTCEYHFGDKQVKAARKAATSFGDDWSWYGVSWKDILSQFPELAGGGDV